MTNQELYDLMDRFQRSGLHSLKFTSKNESVEMTKANQPCAALPGAASAPSTQPAAGIQSQVQEACCIQSPLVGTFYAAPAPGEASFVSAGDRVKEGQTICLIEAMKMMSEVPAPFDCIVERVLKNDGELVAFHEPLFQYRKV